MSRIWAVLALVALLGTASARVVLADSPVETEELRQRSVTVFASGTYTASQSDGDLLQFDHPGLKCVVDVSGIRDAGFGLTPRIEGKDDLSGKYFDVLTGTKITTTSTNVLTVRPDITSTAGKAANDEIPPRWRFRVVADSTANATYSVGCVYLP
jgi:hypothetical protein